MSIRVTKATAIALLTCVPAFGRDFRDAKDAEAFYAAGMVSLFDGMKTSDQVCRPRSS